MTDENSLKVTKLFMLNANQELDGVNVSQLIVDEQNSVRALTSCPKELWVI